MADDKCRKAKEYLQQVKLCDAHIGNKLEELSRLKDMVYHITSTLRGDVVSGGGSKDKLGDAVAKIVTAAYKDAKAKADVIIDQVMGQATAGIPMPK